MKRDITRKHFLHLGIGATAAVLLPACGGDDTGDDTADTGTGPTTTSPTTTSPTTTSPTTTTTDDSSSGDPSTTMPGTETGDPTESSGGTDPTTTTDPTEADTGTTTGGAGCAADPTIAIGGHAGHVLVVTLAEIEAGVEVQYDIMGGSPHTHSVVISAEDFATLQSTGSVVVTSSFESMHEHMITLTCA